MVCLVLAIIGSVVAFVFKDSIASSVLTSALLKKTELKAHVHGFYWNPFKRTVKISKMVLEHETGAFGGRTLEIQQLENEYAGAGSELWNGKLLIARLAVNVSELNIVKLKDGHLNIDPLDKVIREKLDAGDLRIDELILSIKKVSFRQEDKPDHETIVADCNLEDRKFTKIRSAADYNQILEELKREGAGQNWQQILGTATKNLFEDFKNIFK